MDLLLSFTPETFKLVLQPRSDIQPRQFEVRIEGEYTVGKLPDNRGHTDTVITFITTETVSKILLIWMITQYHCGFIQHKI